MRLAFVILPVHKQQDLRPFPAHPETVRPDALGDGFGYEAVFGCAANDAAIICQSLPMHPARLPPVLQPLPALPEMEQSQAATRHPRRTIRTSTSDSGTVYGLAENGARQVFVHLTSAPNYIDGRA